LVGAGFEQLRGTVQAELLDRVPDQIERLRWSREQIDAAQREGLRTLLARAVEKSPFHRQRLGGIDPSNFEVADLGSLPVMTKAQMMEALDAVFTDRRLSRGLVEQALAATVTEPIPILGEYAAVASGGCSGQRGLFVFDREALIGRVLVAVSVADGADAGSRRLAARGTAHRLGGRRVGRAYDRKRAGLDGRRADAVLVHPGPGNSANSRDC
jgi:phenylacetate-coenzyme A ligase PaaK-like adenylate-forming protein